MDKSIIRACTHRKFDSYLSCLVAVGVVVCERTGLMFGGNHVWRDISNGKLFFLFKDEYLGYYFMEI